MLNITTRISVTRASRNYIRNLKLAQNGTFNPKSWERVRKSVKNEISGRLFLNQGLKCVYCERYLIALGHEIDHFAHKALYPEFSFTSINLFYSCKSCNSSARKGEKTTIRNLSPRYNSCTFSIVHPYLDNPNIEIIFHDPDRVFFDWVNCTQKGRDTIDFFQWDDIIYSTIRSRILIFERLAPLVSTVEMQLIQESIAYKK